MHLARERRALPLSRPFALTYLQIYSQLDSRPVPCSYPAFPDTHTALPPKHSPTRFCFNRAAFLINSPGLCHSVTSTPCRTARHSSVKANPPGENTPGPNQTKPRPSASPTQSVHPSTHSRTHWAAPLIDTPDDWPAEHETSVVALLQPTPADRKRFAFANPSHLSHLCTGPRPRRQCTRGDTWQSAQPNGPPTRHGQESLWFRRSGDHRALSDEPTPLSFPRPLVLDSLGTANPPPTRQETGP